MDGCERITPYIFRRTKYEAQQNRCDVVWKDYVYERTHKRPRDLSGTHAEGQSYIDQRPVLAAKVYHMQERCSTYMDVPVRHKIQRRITG